MVLNMSILQYLLTSMHRFLTTSEDSNDNFWICIYINMLYMWNSEALHMVFSSETAFGLQAISKNSGHLILFKVYLYSYIQ